MLWWLLAGLGAVAVLRKKPTLKQTKAAPGAIIFGTQPVFKKAKAAGVELVPEKDKPGAYVGPANEISVQAGWSPVYFHVAEGYDLEWGACFYQWQKDLAQQFGETNAQKKIIGAVGKVMDWVLTEANPIIAFIVKRVCFRVMMPALKVHVTGALGSLELIGPAYPRGLARELPDGTVDLGIGPNNEGGTTINGWNPETSRPGFNAKFTKWPLDWPVPAGQKGGGWLRNLGDIAGIGYPVYQFITAQDGEEKSWPMMTRSGWRAMFRLGGDYVLTAVLNKKGELSNRAAMDLFHTWRPEGSKGLQKGYATKTKATNRYK